MDMKRLFIILLIGVLYVACSDPYKNEVFREADKMPAASLLEANPENYSL